MNHTPINQPSLTAPVEPPSTKGRLPVIKAPRVGVAERPPGNSQQFLAAMVAFRDGDFAMRLPTDWSGPYAHLAEAFNQTIAQKHRISKEMTRLSATVGKEGRLQQRMSLPGAVGGWAAEVDSINTLIDDLVRPTTEIARTIGAVAKGDLGSRWNCKLTDTGSRESSCARRSWSTR